MKNILVIHQSAELYGSDKMLLTLLSRIDRAKFNPIVILPEEGPLKAELEKQAIEVVLAPVLKIYRNIFRPKNLLRFAGDIRRAMIVVNALHKKYRFDTVYSNTLAVLLGMLFSRKKQVRHIWHVHEIIVHPAIIARTFPKFLKYFSDTVICNSYATKSNLVARVAALEDKCIVVHNGINAPSYGNSDPLNIPFSGEDIVVTLVGRISRLKGHKWLLETYYRFLMDTNIKLLFVGSPVPGQEYYLDEIEDIIKTSNLKEKVMILPFMKNLNPVWDVTDIAVMPSTEAESFGLVALEAMLSHKPVVAANHGGLTEIVLDNETGYLVQPGNDELLATAIKNLADDPALRSKFGKSGQQRALSHFSVDNYVAQISKILEA